MGLRDNMVGYWNLDEATGTRNDATANANHLTASASSPTGTTGPGSHNATLFTATNTQCLSHVDNATLTLGVGEDFTVAFWIKLTTASDYQGFIGQGSDSGGTASWRIFQDASPSTGVILQISQNGGNINEHGVNGTVNLGTTSWHFVCASWQNTGTICNVSVDNGTDDTADIAETGVFNSSADILWGAREGPTQYNLNGALAMVGFWKRLLTSEEKTQLYNSGSGRNYAEIIALETGESWNLRAGYRVF